VTIQFGLLGILALCWLGLLMRAARLRRDPEDRAARWICVALAALAASMTLQLAVVHPAVDALTTAGFTALVSNCLTVLALSAARCVFLYMEQGSRAAGPRVKNWTIVWLAVCALMIVLLPTAPSNHAEYVVRLYTADPVPLVSWYGYVYVAYVAPAAAALGWASLRYARLTDRFTLRHGLRLMVAGALVASGYAVVRLAGMVAYDTGVERSVLYGPLVGLLSRIAVVLVLLGLALPAIGPRLGVDRVARWVELNRQYRLLFPLWNALRAEFPGISLDPSPRSLPFAAPDGVLYRRMIEIWDGLLCLRPHMDGAVDAAAVHQALRRKRRGDHALDGGVSTMATGDEVAALTELARQYRDISR
jgi:hypothetical protein